jgi:hypothetical protein
MLGARILDLGREKIQSKVSTTPYGIDSQRKLVTQEIKELILTGDTDKEVLQITYDTDS